MKPVEDATEWPCKPVWGEIVGGEIMPLSETVIRW